MAKREPKSRMSASLEITDRRGLKCGRIELTSGNLIYFRKGAKQETLRLPFQKLLELLERHASAEDVEDPERLLGKGHTGGDFVLDVTEVEADENHRAVLAARSTLRDLDGRRIDTGDYQFSNDMARGKIGRNYIWHAHLSVHAALWVVLRYIDKWLLRRPMTDHTDRDVVISKLTMKRILEYALWKLE